MTVLGRRVVVVAVVVVQLVLVARGYWADHKEFAFQMFQESSTWRADVVRVTADGRRLPVEAGWAGYRWDELVQDHGLRYPPSAITPTPGSTTSSPSSTRRSTGSRPTRHATARPATWRPRSRPGTTMIRRGARSSASGTREDVR